MLQLLLEAPTSCSSRREEAPASNEPGQQGKLFRSVGNVGCYLVRLKDEALSVSAIRGRFFETEGKAFGHVLDPRTGQPVMGANLAAVALPSATETDALSTALLILGKEGHAKIARLRPGIRTWVVMEDGFRVESNV
jgi:thiamine biosynthesis lipoprotein ApbE